MGRRKIISPRSYPRIKRLYKQGKSLHWLAKEYRVSHSCIYCLLKDLKVKTRSTGRAPFSIKIPLKDRPMILELRKTKSFRAIGDMYGVSRQAVRQLCIREEKRRKKK